ncbi:MAG: hypothetical protein VKI83_03435 [Synechococcaceae cyanobacterium]|nr:hypothetical protein [Synechococcaceae cyanobacterium]
MQAARAHSSADDPGDAPTADPARPAAVAGGDHAGLLPGPLGDEARWLRRLSLPLRASAIALCINFVAGVAGANFPPDWTRPGWILNLSVTLVNGATMPMVALCLLQVVAFLERGLAIEQRLLEWFRYLALWAAVGFLMLLPLLGFCSWQVLSGASAEDARQARQAERAIERVEILGRSGLEGSELKRRLEQIPGVRVPVDFEKRDQPQLRKELGQSVLRGRSLLIEQQVGRRNQRLVLMMRNWLRVPLSCLAYALAFGAFARRSNTSRPLYEELGDLRRRLRLASLYERLEQEERRERQDEEDTSEMLGRIRPRRSDPLPQGPPPPLEPWDDDDPVLPRP